MIDHFKENGIRNLVDAFKEIGLELEAEFDPDERVVRVTSGPATDFEVWEVEKEVEIPSFNKAKRVVKLYQIMAPEYTPATYWQPEEMDIVALGDPHSSTVDAAIALAIEVIRDRLDGFFELQGEYEAWQEEQKLAASGALDDIWH